MSILLLLVHITIEVVARRIKQKGEIEIEKELRKEGRSKIVFSLT